MRSLIFIGFCFLLSAALPDANNEPLLRQLDDAIENRHTYQEEKLSRLLKYKREASKLNGVRQYEMYLRVYNEYKSFIYDSAFRYAGKLQDIAYQLNDPVKIGTTKIKFGFVLVSSGMFNEAMDTLRSIRSATLPDSIRSEFYHLMARTCYDLCDFNRDNFYCNRYTARGHAYVDSALAILPANSAQHFLMTGLKNARQKNMEAAQSAFEEVIDHFALADTDLAVAASTLSFIYSYLNQPAISKTMLITAAVADMRSCTKETLATLKLADMLYKEGDIEHAYKYVKIALDDANFYGARHRTVQIAAIFPIIEGLQLSVVESQRKSLFFYSTIITVLSLITIALAIVIYKQLKNLGNAKKVITQANDVLTETNHQLSDANKIKEEYIWYYFNTTADYISKLDTLKKTLDMKLMTRKIDDVRFTIDCINIKKEREQLYDNFDKVFLKLFPGFVTAFNSFFHEKDRISLKDDQLLNTELRIFALIRMGIHDTEKIASILDYSVNTIYTYKTRIRSKSILKNEEFDKQIMSIRAI